MNRATLIRRIDAFLKERKKSNGGYAPVDRAEMDALYEIVRGLVEMKYQADPDGDAPVDVTLTDRTRFERPLVLPIRYTHKPVDGLSELELHQQAAESHGVLAKAASEAVQRHVYAVSQILRKAITGKRPLVLSEVRYVAAPPKGVSIKNVVATLQKAVDITYKKEPAPVDFDQRNAWSRRIADAVTKKMQLTVTERTCMHTVEGVRMYFDVPQFDASVCITSGCPDKAQVISNVEE